MAPWACGHGLENTEQQPSDNLAEARPGPWTASHVSGTQFRAQLVQAILLAVAGQAIPMPTAVAVFHQVGRGWSRWALRWRHAVVLYGECDGNGRGGTDR